MSIKPELLEILACPACVREMNEQAKVRLTADGQGLQCPICLRVYPIREGIPVMLIEEARAEERALWQE
ncbi:MAG: Trm112 family protein [Blastocatellia bacterium]|nr:Trm112 family protein [Blastocatellia bacterium]MCS7156852.1 Trm112 family protein [Blastocatellia bacterium]MCX7752810.1 Trm112 family protein [Blastocatellia bacterium]MDW8167544.1 Trm112 family protein [Acidobacteriota bacterium]MDW8256145.1 Trm112 family protein [Acidobacteriota bacterium]